MESREEHRKVRVDITFCIEIILGEDLQVVWRAQEEHGGFDEDHLLQAGNKNGAYRFGKMPWRAAH